MDEAVLRKQLVELLTGEQAHVRVKDSLEGLAPRFRTARPPGLAHSAWDLLEHLRLSQEDILRYTLDAGWQSPKWPEGYWPPPDAEVSDAAWQASLGHFLADLDLVCAMARDTTRDLTAPIPHGEGRTYLRQILLVADHNAYHAGQIVQLRKALGAWEG